MSQGTEQLSGIRNDSVYAHRQKSRFLGDFSSKNVSAYET